MEIATGIRVWTCVRTPVARWEAEDLSAPYWRTYWNDRPGWEARLGSTCVALLPERLVAIPPDTPFSGHSSTEARQLYLHFSPGPPYDTAPPALHWAELGNGLSSAIRELAQLCDRQEQESPRGALLAHLVCHHALAVVPPGTWSQRAFDPRVALAMHSLAGTPGKPPRNPELAKQARMNTNAFIRLFHSQTGQSPQAWSKRHRIEEACRLLHHSRMSIEQIAEHTGFCDRGHFSRVFTSLRGVGPAQFRKRL